MPPDRQCEACASSKNDPLQDDSQAHGDSQPASGAGRGWRYAPRISFRPSMTRSTSSGEATPSLRPILWAENVRIWLILTQDCSGRPVISSSSDKGKPARCGWLVNPTAITVPERSLKTSALRTRTGRSPDCACPRVGSKSAQRAQRTSPLKVHVELRALAGQAVLRESAGPAMSVREPSMRHQ